MTSQRDQILAHRFAARRIVNAVTGGTAGPARPPDQRLRAGLQLGAAACLVGLGVAAAAGFFRPAPDTTWRTGRALVVEQGTYDRFLYSDGVLHPVRNLASARLLLGSSSTIEVPGAALAGVPRGGPVGVPGAPDDLPTPAGLKGIRWTVCSAPAAADGAATVSAALGVGTPVRRMTGRQALLASAGSSDYLLWQGERHEVADPSAVLAGLGMAAADRPERVAPSWLGTVPAGTQIAPLTVGPRRAAPHGLGTPAKVGDLETVHDASGEHRYVVTGRGLTPVTALQTALLRAGGSPAPRTLGDRAYSTAAAAGLVTDPMTGPDLPADLPELAAPSAICLSVTPGSPSSPRSLSLAPVGTVDTEGAWLPTGAGRSSGAADRTLAAPGSGALVSAGGTTYLITDTGVRNPVGSAQDLGRLGYGGVAPVRVDAALLALFPAGPALSTHAAQEGTAVR